MASSLLLHRDIATNPSFAGTCEIRALVERQTADVVPLRYTSTKLSIQFTQPHYSKVKKSWYNRFSSSLLPNYLGTGHFQRLVIEGCLSNCRTTILSGVSQRSIIGTLWLSCIDINRLSSPTDICAYHTQVVYLVPSSTIPDTVQESLRRIAD